MYSCFRRLILRFCGGAVAVECIGLLGEFVSFKCLFMYEHIQYFVQYIPHNMAQ